MTFNIWKSKINGIYDIQLPNLEQEKVFRKSIRGGRTYKSKNRFESVQYKAYLNGECNFEDMVDYLIDADVVSLYPTAMAHFEYPIGDCIKLDGEKIMKGKLGIYHIKYKTNKNLMHSIGGRRSEDGSLKWDLKDDEGVYTSVDIEDMIENGYDIEILDGYYWEETAPILKDYIEELFKAKEDEAAAGLKGSVNYQLCKLFMNALYGKTIQRPIYTDSKMISTSSEYWKFWRTHTITSLDKVGAKFVVCGTPREYQTQERCITKPSHLGAFILAYSRHSLIRNPRVMTHSQNQLFFIYCCKHQV